MNNLEYREYYRRNLPHLQPRGATFLVNYRLAGSLPQEILDQLRLEAERLEKRLLLIQDPNERLAVRDLEQRRLFGKWDDELHKSQTGPYWLKEDRIAEIVVNSIRYRDGEWFDLLAYCIMPNHGHVVLTPHKKSDDADYGLNQINHNIKRNSAKQANDALGRSGAFWQHESWDHFAREESELQRIIKYVLLNPVQAGLVKHWQDWKWTYCKFDL